MKNRISRRRFLAAAGLTAAAGLLSACGAGTASTAASAGAASAAGSVSAASAVSAADSDWAYISGKGKLLIGVTQYEPMNYLEADGTTWTGFDTEMAEAACAKLGLEPVFQEIDWDNKVIELDAKNIDCIWNGMTITDELAQSIDFSLSYSGNMQVCVINSANKDKFTNADTINAAGVQIGAEAGSAGEAAAQENFPNASYTAVNAQRDCLLELKSGTLDVGVLDYVMAVTLTGDGTDYADLMVVDGLELSKEEFAVGLRKGSDFTAKLNETLQALADDGTVKTLSAKYPTVMVTL
jgi:polar amino acid transport system substrate-binding protein